MRVDFVGHASLLARHGSVALLSDPWWVGSAYHGQWLPYPFPVPERYDLSSVTAVYISHAHEDHLHPATLRELHRASPDLQVIVPRTYDTRLVDYLSRLGFGRIREVPSGGSMRLGRGSGSMRLTLLTHLDDSLMVLEAGGEILVNLNDALHSARHEVIQEYCRLLRSRFSPIDYLFCGFGGASYFPNCIQAPGKDDVAVARSREEFFLRSFALITRLLEPRQAFPFAAHFVLPDERTWWISETRLAMGSPSAMVRRYLDGSSTQVEDLVPGDAVERGVVHRGESGGSRVPAAVRQAVLERFAGCLRPMTLLDAAGFDDVFRLVQRAISTHVAEGRLPRGAELNVLLKLWDYPEQSIRIRVGRPGVQVWKEAASEAEGSEPDAVFQTRSDLLMRTIQTPFGRDLIAIGYGAQVQLRSAEAVQRAPHERLLDLLAPTPPRWRQRLRAHPARTAGFLLRDPGMRLPVKRRLGLAPARSSVDSSADPAL